MSGEKLDAQRAENLRTVYGELCDSYHAINDFRAKSLGLLPLGTGGGIFLLLNTVEEATKQFLLPIGAFGFAVTFGLFAYEVHGISRGNSLIRLGQEIEDRLGIDGQFNRYPRNPVATIPFAASVIYPAVLAAWTFLALVFAFPRAAPWGAIAVFIGGFASSLIRNRKLGRA